MNKYNFENKYALYAQYYIQSIRDKKIKDRLPSGKWNWEEKK